MDLLECAIVANSGGGVDIIHCSGLCGLPNGLPVALVVALLETLSQLELGVGNPSVVLPDIFLGGVASSKLSVEWSEDGSDTGDANSLYIRWYNIYTHFVPLGMRR